MESRADMVRRGGQFKGNGKACKGAGEASTGPRTEEALKGPGNGKGMEKGKGKDKTAKRLEEAAKGLGKDKGRWGPY